MPAATDVSVDYVVNGEQGLQGIGSFAAEFLRVNGDTNQLRPFIADETTDELGLIRGASYVQRPTGRKMSQKLTVNGIEKTVSVPEYIPQLTANAVATLPAGVWLEIDQVIHQIALPELLIVGDLRSRGQVHMISGGMSRTMFLTQRESNTTPAQIAMNPQRKGEADRPVFDGFMLPLPLVYKDWFFPIREVLASRNPGGDALDLRAIIQGTRRVVEYVEQLTWGTLPTFTFNGGTIYGLTNYTGRATITGTLPTNSGYVVSNTINEVLAMMQGLSLMYHKGPYTLYLSMPWRQYLGRDYILTGGNVATQTLEERLKKIPGVQDVKIADFLGSSRTDFEMLLVENKEETVRMVIAMDIVATQHMTLDQDAVEGRVSCIMVPQMLSDMNGNTGICHWTGQ